MTSNSRALGMIAAGHDRGSGRRLENHGLAAPKGILMKTGFALFCLGLCATAAAADAPQAARTELTGTPGIAVAKTATIYRTPSPTVSETSVIRRQDGSLVVNCAQKPNPKLMEQMAAQQSARNSAEPRQP